MAKRGRRPAEEDAHSSGHERWLISYADMVTLLFCLFLVLYAMSKVNEQKFQQLSRSLSKALEHNIDDPTPEPLPPDTNSSPEVNSAAADNARKEAEARREQEILESISHRLGDIAASQGWRNAVHMHLEEAGLVVTLLTDGLMFDIGDAEVRREAIPMILGIAAAVRPFPNLVRVEGHTDNVPLKGGPYKTNWGLSTMRATNVAEVLIRGGNLNPRRLSVLGYGETRPAAPNDTVSNRQRNRRVGILIMRGRDLGR
ncbi:MAG: hypothetical protein FJX76_00585 [Armatimonadetes bacterium]|nr:hypothetical protein [Armatimonadota bacterium]